MFCFSSMVAQRLLGTWALEQSLPGYVEGPQPPLSLDMEVTTQSPAGRTGSGMSDVGKYDSGWRGNL